MVTNQSDSLVINTGVCYFPSPKSKIFAHNNTGVEGLDTEVHCAVNIAQVRQLDPGGEGGE